MRSMTAMTVAVAIFLLIFTSIGADAHRERCRKEVYTVAWWDYPPYIYENRSEIIGIFPKIIKRMVNSCCQGPVNVTFPYALKSRNEAVEHLGNGTADFVLPMIVKTGKDKFLSFPFIPFVDSPGIAFYTASPMSAGESLVYVIAASFPVLILTIVLALIAGTLFWILEYQDASKFGLSMLGRAQDGIWWAFISMTTVGYGDIYPRTKPGQILAVIWIILGIVGVSLFVANVSSFLTTSCISQKTELRGNKIAVITGSQEHSLAIRSSSIPFGCNSVSDLARSLSKGSSSGALIDSYVGGHYQDLFREFRLNDFREDLFSYGVVLRPSVISHERCFKNFIASRQDYIFGIVSENIIPLKKTTDQSTAEEMSSTLLHFDSFAIHVPLMILFGIICAMFATCYLRQTVFQEKQFTNRNKSLKKKASEGVDTLRALEQCHVRELTVCLEQLHKESSYLQESCNRLLSRAEREGNILLNAWIDKETTV